MTRFPNEQFDINGGNGIDVQANAPLPVATLVSFLLAGIVLIRAGAALFDSATAAAFVGTVWISVLISLQRRQARRCPDQLLVSWTQVRQTSLLASVAMFVVVAVIGTLVGRETDSGWALSTVFVGVVFIVEWLVRTSARQEQTRDHSRS